MQNTGDASVDLQDKGYAQKSKIETLIDSRMFG
jgi:hypothetical protein